jgi:hypothetical protein
MPITLDGSLGITTPSYGGTDTSEYLVPVTAFKNRIINGAMVIAQRGTSALTVTNAQTFFAVDRFYAYQNIASSKFTVQQNAGSVTPPAGFNAYLGATSSSAYSVASTDQFKIVQPIEGFNCVDLAWGTANAATITVSFWARSSLTGTFGGALNNGAYDRCYPFTYTISSANTWEYKTVTIAGDTTGTWAKDNTASIQLIFSLGAGSSLSGTAGSWQAGAYISATGETSVVGTNGATFYITGVQLEKGSTATSFDYRPYGTELALCQRYYQQHTEPPARGGVNSSSVATRLAFSLPVTMRSAPSVSITGTLNLWDGSNVATLTTLSSTYSTINSAEFEGSNASGTLAFGRAAMVYINGNNGTIKLNSEL